MRAIDDLRALETLAVLVGSTRLQAACVAAVDALERRESGRSALRERLEGYVTARIQNLTGERLMMSGEAEFWAMQGRRHELELLVERLHLDVVIERRDRALPMTMNCPHCQQLGIPVYESAAGELCCGACRRVIAPVPREVVP